MSRLLNTSGPSRGPLGSEAWTISGVRYDHAPAKFWSALLDEVAEDYPAADAVALEGCCDNLLGPEMLDPANLFTAELDELETDQELDAAISEAAQELDLIGPPSAVRVAVLEKGAEVCGRELPPDVMDAELLPLFVVWPLEWAGLSEFAWNRLQVVGSFEARDEERGWRYAVAFTLDNRHVREGLFRRTLTLRFRRGK